MSIEFHPTLDNCSINLYKSYIKFIYSLLKANMEKREKED